ncbi:hypothetical protein RCOM_1245600 [Ricinus communis]|uniref:NAD(P)-binding domain-containing protein n=1 Tax=Ricinus communis TaxID=3988 RepID=B9RSJ3_RICCO|nr:hypothetical protein RCOM_1245600 [Ricinus communis]
MACKLFFAPIPNCPLSHTKLSKFPQRIPLHFLPPFNISSGYYSSSRTVQSVSSSSSSSSSSSLVVHALKEEVIQSPNSEATYDSITTPPSSSKLVLVIGGSGGVGQLVVASLLNRNIKSRLLLREPAKATALFGKQDEEMLQVFEGDTRNPGDLDPSIFKGITHVICCTGTTAFPSRRWNGDNTPERVDWEGVRNLISAMPSTLKRVVLVSSVGVTKFNELPWRDGKIIFQQSGSSAITPGLVAKDEPTLTAPSQTYMISEAQYKWGWNPTLTKLIGPAVGPFSALIPYRNFMSLKNGGPNDIRGTGRLTDGPYTSYDLNTLLKATAGQRRAVVIDQGDKLVGEVSRLVVAEACIQALDIELTEGQTYEINSVELVTTRSANEPS